MAAVADGRALKELATETELAKHLADTIDAGGWAIADRDERDRFLELARAARSWGISVALEQQRRYEEGYRAGWQAAAKEIAKAIRKVQPGAVPAA
jgi:hypothetical protein